MADRKELIRAMINALIFDKTDEAKPNLAAAMTEHAKEFYGMAQADVKEAVNEAKDPVADVTVSVAKPFGFQDETSEEVAEEYGVEVKVMKSKLKVSGSAKSVKKFLKAVVFADLKSKEFAVKCEEEFPELC
jgi:hypothetical protein